ncbi:DUF6481 family protein [Sphingopyxis yananensis]|uniref:DUF6481 family protein n=1 Tax=Sphingopyxis yananensis TaxID=2886687 RepID=UPI001D1221FC|nr:DUF6481 family protein [Sphingopyxis yananensis]MCC2602768.1 DUF6481 family protein [Sphingopyxis yananensis]
MHGYKEPTLQDRQAIARSAKDKALAQLRARPAIDPAEKALRMERQAQKDEALAAKRADAQFAKAAQSEARKEAAAVKAEATKQQMAREIQKIAPRTPLELKAARDLRYAARQARKGK